MKNFTQGQRVRLVKPSHELAGMQGWTGTVARIRRNDNGAWVQMDRILPANRRAFNDPEDDRFRHVLLFPEECKPVAPGLRTPPEGLKENV